VSRTARRALAVAVAANESVLLWGPPGVGKTSVIREMARAALLPVEVVVASIREPTDFAGLPVVSEVTGTVSLAPPAWASRLAEAGRGVLFLDEISSAHPPVQAALSRVVLERTVGDLALPPNVTIIAAANTPDQTADGWHLALPLANRFCHLDWEVEVEQWAAGMVDGFDAVALPDLDSGPLRAAATSCRELVAAFVRTNPELLSAPPRSAAEGGRAWPSPRTWEKATRLMAAAHMGGESTDVIEALIRGCVGQRAGDRFLDWAADAPAPADEQPDPEAALADPDGYRLPADDDCAFSALAALTSAVLLDNTATRWEAGWRAIAAATRHRSPDVALPALRQLIAHRPAGSTPPWEVLGDIGPLLSDAGLIERLTAPPTHSSL